MAPDRHRLLWAQSLKVNQMDDFITEHSKRTEGFIVIVYKGNMITHRVVDVLEIVRYVREECRKDDLMKKKEQ